MLFKARDTLKGYTRKQVKAPDAPFAREIGRWNGWAIFECESYYDEKGDAYFAVHEDTGETRQFDVTGYVRGHDIQLFRDLIDLGFPTRSAVESPSPLTASDVAKLKAEVAA